MFGVGVFTAPEPHAMIQFLAQTGTYLLLPFLLLQGLWVRLRTPRLPEAAEPYSGVVESLGQPLDLIVLGESPVAGIGAPTHELALTGRIAAALARRAARSVRWQALGLSGATAQRALRELVPLMAGKRVDIVVVVLGVNDVLGWRGPSRWAHDLELLIAEVRQQTGAPLIILTGVPPFQCFPAFPRPLNSVLGRRARLLDRAAADLAAALSGVIHVSSLFELDKEFFCADGFHPSQMGYAVWGERLAEAIVLA
jgi:lysophospholipase L1-like esterase